jgi:hypothetical protein
MISWYRGGVVMLACGALCGCQAIGNGRAFSADEKEIAHTIQLNQSTKEDVERQFGRAKVYRFANGYETWSYQKTEGIPRFVDYLPVVGVFTQLINDRVVEVAFLFDAQGTLRNIDRRPLEEK